VLLGLHVNVQFSVHGINIVMVPLFDIFLLLECCIDLSEFAHKQNSNKQTNKQSNKQNHTTRFRPVILLKTLGGGFSSATGNSRSESQNPPLTVKIPVVKILPIHPV